MKTQRADTSGGRLTTHTKQNNHMGNSPKGNTTRTYYYNARTTQRTEATIFTDKNRYLHFTEAVAWFNAGDTVYIVNADTGEIVITWEH